MSGKTGKAEKAQKSSWFKGMKAEFKKIVWPDKNTAAVVIVSVLMGALISVIDVLMKYGIDFLIK